MKHILAFALFAAFALKISAVDFQLTDGRVLKEAAVISQSPTAVMVKHSAGLSSISKTLLPSDLQAKYPVDEVRAKAEAAREAAERTRRQADKEAFQKAEAERMAAEEKYKQSEEYKTFHTRISAMQEEMLAKSETISGMATLGTYRNIKKPIAGLRIYFCTEEAWAAYQTRRKETFGTDYEKRRREMDAQPSDIYGQKQIPFEMMIAYRRWLSSTYEEIPEAIAAVITDENGEFSCRVAKRPVILFARREGSVGDGWDYILWAEKIQFGATKITLSKDNSVKREDW